MPAELRRTVTLEGRYERASDRARSYAHKAWQSTNREYRVMSSDGTRYYAVSMTARGLICDCKAGQYGNPCKHASKVARRLQREGKSI